MNVKTKPDPPDELSHASSWPGFDPIVSGLNLAQTNGLRKRPLFCETAPQGPFSASRLLANAITLSCKHAKACLPAKVIASASGCDGRASLAAIIAKIVHDMPVVDFIEDLNRTLLGFDPAIQAERKSVFQCVADGWVKPAVTMAGVSPPQPPFLGGKSAPDWTKVALRADLQPNPKSPSAWRRASRHAAHRPALEKETDKGAAREPRPYLAPGRCSLCSRQSGECRASLQIWRQAP